jgi:hypothetical protein
MTKLSRPVVLTLIVRVSVHQCGVQCRNFPQSAATGCGRSHASGNKSKRCFV